MGMNRDVMVHSAVTIVPRIDGFHLPPILDQVSGLMKPQQDIEVCQFCFELPAKKLPWPEKQLREAMKEQMEMLIIKMRAAGMIRS